MEINALASHRPCAFSMYEEQIIFLLITITAQTQQYQYLINKCACALHMCMVRMSENSVDLKHLTCDHQHAVVAPCHFNKKNHWTKYLIHVFT